MIASAPSSMQIVWPATYSEVPKEIFHREDVYRLELERLFNGPEWHIVAHVAEVPERGDFKAAQIGETPLLIVHGDDDRIRVFYNVCPHRGTQLQTCSRGNGSKIECPYHRWTFSNDGDLLGAPGNELFPETFRKENYGLRELHAEEICGLVFATCGDDAPDLAEYLGETKNYFAQALGGGAPLKLLGYQKVVFDANWKAYKDNDGYHPPLLHRAFRLMRWQGGQGRQCITERGHMVLDAEVQPPSGSYLSDMSLVEFKDTRRPQRSTVVNFFPGLAALVQHLDVINVRFAFPRSKDQTEVHYAYFCRVDDDAEMTRHRIRQAANFMGPSGFVSLEDGAVFNRIQRASKTPGPVEFQKGVTGPIEPPYDARQNDEASNLVKWECYRRLMGFDRAVTATR